MNDNIELEHVLNEESAQKYFMEFLTSEYSQENLQFWLECEKFKKITNKKQLKKCAEHIYATYICPHGSRAINIDVHVRKAVEEQLKKPFAEMFDAAQNQIFHLMKNDSFSRFVFSKHYIHVRALFDQTTTPDRQTRKRKFTTDNCSGINACEENKFDNESTPKNIKLTNEPVVQHKESMLVNTPAKSPVNTNARFKCHLPMFKESDEDDDDCYSLYCNAPIYSNPNHHSFLGDSKICADNSSSLKLCRGSVRIILPDSSSENISITINMPIHMVVDSLLQRKGLHYSSYQIFSVLTNQKIDLDQDISSLMFTDVRVEQRVNFAIHFPEGYLINVETRANELAYYTIKAILSHFGITLEEIELSNQLGHLLDGNSLMQSTLQWDQSKIYVRYLSSLRTYINLKDINELNENGITIKSIEFDHKFGKTPNKKRGHDLVKSFSSFVIDSELDGLHKQSQDNKRENPIETKPHIYTNVTESMKKIDLAELSFSNESETDKFLTSLISNDVSNLQFVCTPNKKKPIGELDHHLYQNVPLGPTSEVSDPMANVSYNQNSCCVSQFPKITPIHKSTVPKHESRTICQKLPQKQDLFPWSEMNSSTVLKPKRSNHNAHNPQENRENVLKPVNNQQMTRSVKPRKLVPNISTDSSSNTFRKYLLQQVDSASKPRPVSRTMFNVAASNPNTPSRRKNTISTLNQHNYSVTPAKVTNKPDIVECTVQSMEKSSSVQNRSQMRTLSKFHKFMG